MGVGLTPKGQYEGVFWDKETVLNLDCGDCSMTVYSFQNSQNCNPKQLLLYVNLKHGNQRMNNVLLRNNNTLGSAFWMQAT